MENSLLEDMIEPCLICGAKTKGLHLQINSCRACAEFFRRSIQANRSYICMRGTQDCNLTRQPNEKRLCKFCRFEKCKQVGMCLEQDNEKDLKNTIQSESQLISNTTNLLLDKKVDSKSFVNIKLDLTTVEKTIRKILDEPIDNELYSRAIFTRMQRLSYGFSQFYEEIRPKGTVIITHEFDLYTLYMFHSKFMVAFAKMLMHCEKFSTLDNKDKFLLFKNSWKFVVQLERYYSSAKYFGNSFDDLRLLHDNETAHDFSQFDQLRLHFYTQYFSATSEKYYQLWIPYKHKMQELLMKPIKSLQLTEYEMVYLIAQTLWNVQDLENLSENARLVAEEVSEQINHEMHNYYVHDIGMVNYANRLVKLTKLIENNKIVLDSKRDVFVIARIFELFDCDIIESELYDWKK